MVRNRFGTIGGALQTVAVKMLDQLPVVPWRTLWSNANTKKFDALVSLSHYRPVDTLQWVANSLEFSFAMPKEDEWDVDTG